MSCFWAYLSSLSFSLCGPPDVAPDTRCSLSHMVYFSWQLASTQNSPKQASQCLLDILLTYPGKARPFSLSTLTSGEYFHLTYIPPNTSSLIDTILKQISVQNVKNLAMNYWCKVWIHISTRSHFSFDRWVFTSTVPLTWSRCSGR